MWILIMYAWLYICSLLGDMLAEWLLFWILDWVVLVPALAGFLLLCSLARHFTICTLPCRLSLYWTHVHVQRKVKCQQSQIFVSRWVHPTLQMKVNNCWYNPIAHVGLKQFSFFVYSGDRVIFAESPSAPGVPIVYRLPEERQANPDRLNLDRYNARLFKIYFNSV